MSTSAKRRNWNRDELLIAFNLYCRLPFGRIHSVNPDVIALAKIINRTPNAVAMKLVNFASLDPAHQKRNVKGLKHVGKNDIEIWKEFNNDWEQLALESNEAYNRISQKSKQGIDIIDKDFTNRKHNETVTQQKIRLTQSFFRAVVVASYDNSCAICQLNHIELLNASHIIPWSVDSNRRVDPTNGIALCALHDRAFDRGLLSIDDSFHIILSTQLKEQCKTAFCKAAFIDIENKPVVLPQRFEPDRMALQYHRENIFKR